MPKFFAQIRIFTPFDFPAEIKGFKHAQETGFFAEFHRVSNIFVGECLKKIVL